MAKVYQNVLPNGLPKGIPTEAKLWDEFMKKMVHEAPNLLLYLINEVHGKFYPPDTPLLPLATEYSVQDPKTKALSSIYSDITVIVDSHDIYHFECQIDLDGTMIMRMFEYDVHLALSYASIENSHMELQFPRSSVLYLEDAKNVPDELTCTMRLPNGTNCIYQVPTIKVQSYTLDVIKEKHLSILIPYLPLRYRKMIVHKKISKENALKELTSLFMNLILLLKEEVASGFLSANNCILLQSLLQKSFIRVTQSNPALQEEVRAMTEPILELEVDEILHKYKDAMDRLAKVEDIEQRLFTAEQNLSKAEQNLSNVEQDLSKVEQENTELKKLLEEQQELIAKLQKEHS